MPSGMWWIGTKQILSFPKSSITQLAMKIANKSIKSFLVLTFAFAHYLWSQDKGEPKPGAIIVLSAKGLVQAIDPAGNVVAGTLKPGAVLAEGYSLKTGFEGEAAMVFSNGSVATVEPRSQVKVSTFLQNSFDGGNQKLSEIQTEPSSSQISLDIDTGSLVVQTKKLDRTSNFTINSPNGTAGIRGTEFQLAVSSTGETKLDVASSTVSFTPSGGDPILVSQGKGVDISNAGAVNQRPIDPVIAVNISTKNAFASNIAGQIPLTTVNQAKEKAAAIAVLSESGADQESSEDTEKDNDEDADDDSGDAEGEGMDAREQAIQQSAMVPSTISAAELAKSSYDYLNKIDELLNPPNVNPGSDPGYNPGTPPHLNATEVSYSWDSATGITIHFLNDNGDIVDTKLISSNNTYDEILDSLGGWTTSEDKTIDALALLVFMEELTQDPTKYQNFNTAIQSAIEFGRIFLADVTLSSSIPAPRVFNADRLVTEFTQNPYAHEFGKLLVRYGAIGGANGSGSISGGSRGAGDAILDLLGQGKLGDANYLSSLLDKAIRPGDTYNGRTINGDLLGTRPATISSKDADLLKISTKNVNGVVGGDIKISANSNLDVSPYLQKKTSTRSGEKIFAIAAAKDLHIEGDVTFANTNHAEDHALALGAADHIEVTPGSSIKYEGSNLGMGSYSSLTLTDVDIDVGGNLAIGSLQDLNIKSTDSSSPSIFSVGRYSDTDNIYLYADNIMQIDGLGFNSNTRHIYAEAITLNLKDVTFPSTSEVMLRSQDGSLHFDNFDNYQPGAVNLTNVKYGSDVLQKSHFNGNAGKYDSTFSAPSGTAGVKIRAFPK